ncbi:MAG: RNA polymerase sigma factor RpoE [Gammaproteobacteria bacterium RBG_16_57_12]|nr:MAG: RNA polymerase sigma factor RpoE [Gammaproteobacteria bacterium RBG_16_57_12]
MGEQSTDQELVARVQKGDKKAYDLLVLKYQHKIAKLISRYIADPSEVLDVSQDAFIKAYRALPNFRGDSAFYTWMYRIAINTAKNYLVAHGRRVMEIDIDAEGSTLTETDMGLQDVATPEEMLIKDEVERTVFEAIEQLPDDLRTAITLREMDGLSYEEIAQAMDCPVGTVRSRIFRAREAIAERLRQLLGE